MALRFPPWKLVETPLILVAVFSQLLWIPTACLVLAKVEKAQSPQLLLVSGEEVFRKFQLVQWHSLGSL